MIKNLDLQKSDGSIGTYSFKACGTTAIRYQLLFNRDLMEDITSIISNIAPAQLAKLALAQAKMEESGGEVSLEDLDQETLQALIKMTASGDIDSITRLAFIMNKQADGTDMSSLTFENYLDWLEVFEPMELQMHTTDFINLYVGNKVTSIESKKKIGQPIGR